MNESFSVACTQVLEILKYLPQDEYQKIPKYEIEFLQSKKDEQYKFDIDKSLPLQQMNISKRANAIFVILWEKYFAKTNQKEKLYAILKQNYQKEEENKKKKYSNEELFKKVKKNDVSLIPVEKDKWFKKIYKFFTNIINRFGHN